MFRDVMSIMPGEPSAFSSAEGVTEQPAPSRGDASGLRFSDGSGPATVSLREQEDLFRVLVENIREVFWMRDLHPARMLYVSPNYAQLWGQSPESLYADLQSWQAAIHADDRQRIVVASERSALVGGFDEQFRIVRPDGAERWVRSRTYPVRDAAGAIRRIVGVAEDVTERKLLEEQFLRAQRMEAIGTLAGGVAHDLNNILSPMLMAAGLLKETAVDPHARDLLGMVEKSARRGAGIVRQLLTFSRGASGERMPVAVRHLVKEIAAIVRETFPREISLVAECSPELWPVMADATQLHQVLINLCVNARDAMPAGGRLSIHCDNVLLSDAERVTHGPAKPGPYVRISVADTGTGIPAEIVDRIFDPFFTTKTVEKGTGLGLSTVLGILRSHEGFVTVETQVGHGSTFRVHLPATPEESPTAQPATSTPFPSGAGELILVVDDEDEILAATRRVLESHRYRVLTASNGRQAVDLYVEWRDEIRLVVTDMMMPEMGGAALVRALRVLNPNVKVIATSGLEAGGAELASLGVANLPKPCGLTKLLRTVRRELQESAPAP